MNSGSKDNQASDPVQPGTLMPNILNFWTVDTLAEVTDDITGNLYRKLWSFITPETDGENAPVVSSVWHLFSSDEQAEIIAAVKTELNDE